MNEIHDPVMALGADPLFQLSTAGQELFHTNMLFWLAVNHPGESAPIWSLLGVDAPTSGESYAVVRREWRHLDLVVDSGMPGRKLVIENKVLAIPAYDQLRQYHDDAMSKPSKVAPLLSPDVTSWVLLTLLPPLFEVPRPWRVVSYDELVPAVRATARNLESFDAALVGQYATLIEKLIAVRNFYGAGSDLTSAFGLPQADRDRLAQSRVLSLVEKIRISQLAAMVTSSLTETVGKGFGEIGVGLSNTHGVMTWLRPVPGRGGRRIGWQYEAGQFRLVVISGPSGTTSASRQKRELAVESEFGHYFDFDALDGGTGVLGDYTGTRNWLGYSPDFVYRYRPLMAGTGWGECAALCVRATVHAIRLVEDL